MDLSHIFGEKTFIKDVIHDSIELSPIAKSIIDCPIFQRLRNLHQLGVCFLIFPNANNNRFEHSIGTYHLAGLMIEKLIRNSSCKEVNKALIEVKFIKNYLLKHFEIEDNEESMIFLERIEIILLDDYLKELIKIAGLVHDIGHGPFSHLFDEWLHSKSKTNSESESKSESKTNSEFESEFESESSLKSYSESKLLEHESRSVLLLKKIIDEKTIIVNDEEFRMNEFIDDDAFEFIAELINPNDQTPKSNFIFQIISNSLNGLDVDKLDYLCRDSFYFGSGKPFDLMRVISHTKVINGNICFPEKISYEIYKVFRARYDLHKQFYNHKTTICVEYMIRDILENLDPILKISENIKNENISKFIELDDHVVLDTAKLVKNFDSVYSIWKRQIDMIQKITDSINNRNLYKCIYGETFFANEEMSNRELFGRFKSKYSDENLNLTFDSENITIVKLKIGLLGGNKSHPLDSVYFFDNNGNSGPLDKEKISHLVSESHQEIIYYIIYKKLFI